MRIQQLSYDFFGMFTSKVLDFGEAKENSDFHIIYGPNEAGKTTAMEGYLRLLYGFPSKKEPYAFQHQRKNLKISGVLEIEGVKSNFTRLSTQTGNLRGDAGATIPETAIASHLGGLSPDDYRSLLCLDDETIEKGGEDIANARGDIGRLLFSAAAGISNLNAVLEQIQEEADMLYKKRASSTRVAVLKRELKDIEGQIKEFDISATEWRKLKQALQVAEREEKKEKEACGDLRIKKEQAASLIRALPNLGKLDRLLEEVAKYSNYPESINITTEELISLTRDQGTAEADIGRLKDEIDTDKGILKELVVDITHLELTQKLYDLDELRSRMITAGRDLPKRQKELKDAEGDLSIIARELGASKDCDIATLVKSEADISALEKNRDVMRNTATARDTGAQEVDLLEERVQEAKKTCSELTNNAPTKTGLLDLLSKYDADTLAAQEAAASQEISTSDESLQDALDALSVGGCVFTSIPDCKIDPSTAKKLATQHEDLKEEIKRAKEDLANYEENISVQSAQITRLAKNVGVVSDEDARQARNKRDELWKTHCEQPTSKSAATFEAAMKDADNIGDTRLSHAQELGELRQYEKFHTEAETLKVNTEANLKELKQQINQIESGIKEMTSTIGLPNLSPDSFIDWMDRYNAAKTAQQKRDGLVKKHQSTLDRAEQLRETLTPLISLEKPTFEAALVAARHLAEDEREYQDELNAAQRIQKDSEKQLESRRETLAKLEEEAKSASENWTTMVQTLFGGSLQPKTLDNSLAQLHKIREHDGKRVDVERRISSMEADQSMFTDAITKLSLQYKLDESDPLEIFNKLRRIAEQAQDNKTKHDDLTKKIEKATNTLKDKEALQQNIERVIGELGAQFPKEADTSTADALHSAVSKAQEIIQKRKDIADLENLILTELSVQSMGKAREMLDNATTALLEANSRSIKTELEHAEALRTESTAARVNASRDLSLVTGDTEIAELEETKVILQMQIEDSILEYIEIHFGLRLAEEAIRRYREKHRSDMMKATELAFSELTSNAYKKLQTQPNGPSEILLAIDANGTSKQINDMSKGTRFQLYLALRAAAYEQMVSQGVQLPFFCDDVFETFDDERTSAACLLMERIGRRGQAIYLTHHQHVVDIAKEVCEKHPMIHTL
jgi:uncharacterized protein YhaN